MSPLKKNIFHPSFIIGAFSFFLLISGVVFRKYDFPIGDYVILSGLLLGAVHWLWSSIDVFTNKELNSQSRMFWMIMVLLIPPVGGMMYYLMQSKNVRL
jgi:hypothetical protein